MKKLITFLLFVLLVSSISYSQTTRKYEYAMFDVIHTRIFIHYGDNKGENFKDVMKNKSKEDYNIVDALNYMDEQAYELVAIEPESNSRGPGQRYIFRREIKK